MYLLSSLSFLLFFFFNDTATTEIYTLSLHDALPISCRQPASATSRWSGPTAKTRTPDRKSTRLNSSHSQISYAVFCLKKKKIKKFDLSLRSSKSSYFATFLHQLTILSKTDALDEEKWLNMLGTFVKDWFRYESHFVHGRDSLVDILKERGLLSESDAVQPLIGKKS